MCGITGYVGKRKAAEILLGGLARLEYRGYDSAGLAVVNGGKMNIRKKVGKVKELKAVASDVEGTVGIGHTRWATHGEPSEKNAHPHVPSDSSFALVHNGIVENYSTLREMLTRNGCTFYSETDTEVLVKLIDHIKKTESLTLQLATRKALTQVQGTYGICICSQEDPDILIAARMGSPLIVGVGEEEYFVASDASAFLEYTRNVLHLNDGEMAVVHRTEGHQVSTLAGQALSPRLVALEGSLEQIEKGGYKHFMLKEIMEQPTALLNCMRGRVCISNEPGSPVLGSQVGDRAHPLLRPAPIKSGVSLTLGGIEQLVGPEGAKYTMLDKLRAARRIIICGCGTSWHAGLVGEYILETLCKVPVEVEYASEFRYRNAVLRADEDVVIVISQSGETADTLAALRYAKSQGVLCMGICNTVGSTIARETDGGIYLHAGPEIGVASTKAFTCQVTVLAMLALRISHTRTISDAQYSELALALSSLPNKIDDLIRQNESKIVEIAKVYRFAHHCLFLGRGYNYPVALEGALKMKEISYIHAEVSSFSNHDECEVNLCY
mmetsp:Transcript_5944/g.19169  ORF Transcript_5944/g.19169 Transcript_5944/m.19169 type:complete len:553 (+) Transcript_5944:243-1901(+)